MSTAATPAFLRSALVWDNHACMPLRPGDDTFLPQLARHRAAGANVVTLNVGFDAVPAANTSLMLESFRRWLAARPDEYLLIETVDDIETARRTGRLGVLFDIEGGCALEGRLERVADYYRLGVRWMLIAYNQNNALGGGCQDEDTGLTDFGRQVLAEMERVGMVACCSHTGFRTTMDVMECARQPVIFSHSNPAGMWQHRRNISDAAIRACARTDGVIGLNGIGIFLGRNDASTATFLAHVRYVVDLVGPRHVGLGLDYCFDTEELDDFLRANPQMYPPEDGYACGVRMIAPEQIPEIVEGLLRGGYGDDEVRGILGGNLLRVARQVWKPVGAAA